jgi:hypothetical protein
MKRTAGRRNTPATPLPKIAEDAALTESTKFDRPSPNRTETTRHALLCTERFSFQIRDSYCPLVVPLLPSEAATPAKRKGN